MPYLTLDGIPSGRICRPLFIPDDPMWLALFGGALTELTFPYRYEQFGTLTPQEMADACAEIIAQWYADICSTCELPDNEPILTVDEDFNLRQLIDGEWQEPTGDYYLPPPDARTEPTTEERKCLAATNAEQALHDVYEAITDAFGTGLAVLEALADVAIFISARVFAGAGLVWSALGRIALAAFRIGFEAVEFVTADFWDADFSRNLRCTLLRAATDTGGVITFDFDAVNKELINQIEWLDPTLGSFAIAGQVRWMLAQLTPESLNLMGALTDVTEADCFDCDALWCYRWYGSDLGNWDAVVISSTAYAVFATDRWTPVFFNDTCADHSYVYIDKTYGSTYNFGLVQFKLAISAPGGFTTCSFQLYNGATLVGIGTGTSPDGGTTWRYDFGGVNATRVIIATNVCANPTGYAIVEVQAQGEGENPEGADNC